MSKLSLPSFLTLSIAVGLFGCQKREAIIPYDGSSPIEIQARPTLRFSFEETEGDYVYESVSKQSYSVEYLFQNAAFKKPEKAKRYQGVVGQSMDFDGQSTRFEADAFAFPEKAFTLSLYIAPRAFERNDGMYSGFFSNFDGVGGIELSLNQYGYWRIRIGTEKGVYQGIVSDFPLLLYRWNHLLLSYEESEGSIQAFLNGEKVHTLDLRNGKIHQSSSSLRIGQSKDANTMDVYELCYFNGLLDEVVLYDGALSAVEKGYLASKAKEGAPDGIWKDYDLLASDRYAPQYHMKNPIGWANEFYGGFYHKGNYHVFSQHNPFRGAYQNGQRWGHLYSEDLVHWKATTPALTPEKNHIDDSQCFSGSALVKDGVPYIFYTGVNEGNEQMNSISYATPKNLDDPTLSSWQKLQEKVIEQGDNSNNWDFRDPFLYEENGVAYMLIGGNNTKNNPDDGAVFLYESRDPLLKEWKNRGVFFSSSTAKYPELGNCYELPCLYKLSSKDGKKSKYMLIVSPINGGGNGVYYWLGDVDFDNGRFLPESEEPTRYDLGPANQVLASSGFFDPVKKRNLFTTMMRTKMKNEDAKKAGWNGLQTLWKEVCLEDDGSLAILPIEEYRSLEKEVLVDVKNSSLSIAQANEICSLIHEDLYKVELLIEPREDSKTGLILKYGQKSQEEVDYYYDLSAETFYCNAAHSSLDLRNNGSGGAPCRLKDKKQIRFTAYVDRGVSEVYLNAQNQISSFACNSKRDSDSLKIYSDKQTAIIKSLKIIRLSSAYGEGESAYWGEEGI